MKPCVSNAQSEPSGEASQPQDELRKEIEREWFDRGTIVAAAILLNVWGDTTQAAEILSAAGIDHKRAKELAEVEPDLEVVRFLAKQRSAQTMTLPDKIEAAGEGSRELPRLA